MYDYTPEQMREHIVASIKASPQAKVAKELGMSQSALSLIVTGKRGISEEVAAKFGFRRRTVFSAHIEPASLTARGNR